ncbi:MAG: mechanosensitive ion channel domain-containing protein [Flavobacteriales bacterium]
MDEFFNIDLSQLSIFKFLGLVILGALTYTFMYVFKNYLVHFVIKSPVRRKRVIAKLPVIYTLIWILFVLYALYIFIKPFPFLGVILCLVFVYLGRGYLMNLIHGLFFRLKGDIDLGQKIAIEEHSGTVHKMNVFEMEIQNKEGEIIQIPYGNMFKKEIVKKNFSSDFSSFKFSILVSDQINEQDIKNKIFQMPWVSLVFQPTVTRTMQSEGNRTYDIIVYALDEKFFTHIENDLKASLSKN